MNTNYTKFSENLEKDSKTEELEEKENIEQEEFAVIEENDGEIIDTPVEEIVDLDNLEELDEPEEKTEDEPEEETEDEPEEKTIIGIVNVPNKLNVRKEPTVNSEVIGSLENKFEILIMVNESTDDFYKVYNSDIDGYCMKKFINIK